MTIERMPESIAIIGAGAIGVAFAYYFSTFGSKVTLIEMLPQLLPAADREISEILRKNFARRKIEIRTEARVEEIGTSESGVDLTLQGDDGPETISASVVLMAVGIRGNIENMGLEEAGVETDGSFIKTDELCRTNVERSSRTCFAASCGVWRPPTRWSWGSTSAASKFQ